MEELQQIFQSLVEAIGNADGGDFKVDLRAERSHFCRFNRGRVRQNGLVWDGELCLKLIDRDREIVARLPFTEDYDYNLAVVLAQLPQLHRDLAEVPPSPYVVVPQNYGSRVSVSKGVLLEESEVIEAVLSPLGGLDFCGFYGAGEIVRGHGNSAGQLDWFAMENFVLDYSIFAEGDASDRAVKDIYSGQVWCEQIYRQQVQQAQAWLQKLTLPGHRLCSGEYRAYLAPAAIAEILELMNDSASEAALQQKRSPLLPLRAGRELSAQFNLQENFALGHVPQFNFQREPVPAVLPIIEGGKLVNTLVSARSGLEYDRLANSDLDSERWQSPQLLPGKLLESEILSCLGTGIYISNLHYLNWSDLLNGCFTGMTRYACFWVEGGEIVAPISNLRFDDSIYRCFGDRLIDLTSTAKFIPDVSTYERRALGGVEVPGILLEGLRFTL